LPIFFKLLKLADNLKDIWVLDASLTSYVTSAHSALVLSINIKIAFPVWGRDLQPIVSQIFIDFMYRDFEVFRALRSAVISVVD
jgi:hypothetical protein